MRRILRTLIAFAVVTAGMMPSPAAATHCDATWTTREPPEDVRLELTVPQTTVLQGQPVPMIMEVENTGDRRIRTGQPKAYYYYLLWVTDAEGHVIWYADNPLSALAINSTSSDTLEPGEHHVIPQAWDGWTCASVFERQTPADPGRYTAQFGWIDSSETWKSNAVEFTVIPE